MDLYLADEDLSAYATDLYKYQKLTTIEKALLAKRVPEMVPVIVQAFKDEYKPPSETTLDRRFDAILGASVLNVEQFQQSLMMKQARAAPAAPAGGLFGAAYSAASPGVARCLTSVGSARRHRISRKCTRIMILVSFSLMKETRICRPRRRTGGV